MLLDFPSIQTYNQEIHLKQIYNYIDGEHVVPIKVLQFVYDKTDRIGIYVEILDNSYPKKFRPGTKFLLYCSPTLKNSWIIKNKIEDTLVFQK